MKRIVAAVLLGMLTMGVHGKDPWAEHKESVAARAREGNAAQSGGSSAASAAKPKTQNITVLPKILRGEPLKVNVETSWKMNENACATAKQRVQNAYNAWFQNAANTIKTQHREQEFKDVLPTLQKGVRVEVNCVAAGSKPAPADVTVSFKKSVEEVQKECGSNRSGCWNVYTNGAPMKVIVPGLGDDFDINSNLVHEFGHTLGLADAYPKGYEQNASQTHRSKQRENYSVMNGFNLKPDDADGLINIMDSWNIHHAKQAYGPSWQQHLSPRVTKGWDGLDRYEKTGSSKDRYRGGTSVSVQTQNKAR